MFVSLPPMLNPYACFLHGCTLYRAQALVAELATVALHAAILPGASWFS